MSAPGLNAAVWRKSSYSANNGACVEVAFLDGDVATRDSKDPLGPALRFRRQQWASFLHKLKTSANLDLAL